MPYLMSYPYYRRSDVGHLENVPDHWSLVQLGRIGIFSKGSGGTKDDEVPFGIPCVRYGDLYTTHNRFIDQTRGYIIPEKSVNYTGIQRGDILFPASGETIEEIGKSAVNMMDAPVYCGGDLIIFRPTTPVDPRFAGYALDAPCSQDQKSRMGRGVSIMHIYSNQLKYLWLALPPLDEQAAIVRYLDDADQRIRNYVSAKERHIALLEEERMAVIHQAVTQGVDPNVKLKPSGVEWLGEVPEYWTERRLKQVATIQAGITLGKEYRTEELVERPYLRVANVQSGHLDLSKIATVQVPLAEVRKTTLEIGDVLMTEGGDIDKLGRGCIWQGEVPNCLHQNHVFAVRTKRKDLNPAFLVTLMETSQGRNYFHSTAKQTTNLAATNRTTLGEFPMYLPDAREQQTIVDYISEQAGERDTAIAYARRQIELMEEYRIRLIADVVTGKINVSTS